MNMKDTTTATVRTTVNTTALTLIATLATILFDIDIEVDDLLPYLPAIAAVIAVFYRASRAITGRFPKLAYILFGLQSTPSYDPPAPPPAG